MHSTQVSDDEETSFEFDNPCSPFRRWPLKASAWGCMLPLAKRLDTEVTFRVVSGKPPLSRIQALRLGTLTRLLEHFESEGAFNRATFVSELLGFIYFVQPVAGCTTIKLNINFWEAAAQGVRFTIDGPEDIHNRKLSPLKMPRAVGYRRFIGMLASRDVLKFTSWRHPRDRLISAYLKKVRRRSNACQALMAEFPGFDNRRFTEFVSLIANERRALLLNSHWRPQAINVPVDIVEIDRVLLLDSLKDDLGDLSRALLGKRIPVLDSRDYHKANQSNRESASDLLEMMKCYDSGAAHLFERDLIYFEQSVAARF